MKISLFFKPVCLLFILLLGVSACSPVTPVAETDYSADILGQWAGTVEGMEESITFREDGQFKALVRPDGFISNTISQGTTGSISGTWAIDGETITLKITGAVDETVVNRETTSVIQSFNSNELVLKSDGGETSTFTREVSL
jgi:Lipocalin-like domain